MMVCTVRLTCVTGDTNTGASFLVIFSSGPTKLARIKSILYFDPTSNGLSYLFYILSLCKITESIYYIVSIHLHTPITIMKAFFRILAAASLFIGVHSDEYNHKYNPGDAVQFYVHKVGADLSRWLMSIRNKPYTIFIYI